MIEESFVDVTLRVSDEQISKLKELADYAGVSIEDLIKVILAFETFNR